MHKYKKYLGQNFLFDKNVINKIIRAVKPQNTDTFVEIGPGQGALSLPLSRSVSKLVVIEKDKTLLKSLKEKLKDNSIIINSDILKTNLCDYVEEEIRILGNLPYNISTEIIFKIILDHLKIKDVHFMLQREVVDRIVSNPGNRQYGRISVMCQTYYKIKKLFDIPPTVFFPQPKVWSSYIKLIPRRNIFLNEGHEENFKNIVNLAFISRRKMLKTSLKKVIKLNDLCRIIKDPSVRPEQLTSDDFLELSKYV